MFCLNDQTGASKMDCSFMQIWWKPKACEPWEICVWELLTLVTAPCYWIDGTCWQRLLWWSNVTTVDYVLWLPYYPAWLIVSVSWSGYRVVGLGDQGSRLCSVTALSSHNNWTFLFSHPATGAMHMLNQVTTLPISMQYTPYPVTKYKLSSKTQSRYGP